MIEYEKLSHRELKALNVTLAKMEPKLREIDGKGAALNGQIDEAADVLKRMTEPLQVERAQIERRQTDAIIDGKPEDEADKQRLINVEHEIFEANALFERTRDECNRRKALLKKDRDTLMENYPNKNLIETWLVRTGDKQKQIRHEGLREAVRGIQNTFLFAYGRQVDDIRDAYKKVKEKAAKDKSYTSQANEYQQKLTRMEATLSAASAATNRMQEEAKELYRELIEA